MSGLQTEAAVRGLPLHQVAAEKCREALRQASPRAGANAMWSRMPMNARCLLVTVATKRRDIERAAAGSWLAFESGEQAAIGAAAREMRRAFDCAEWLR